MNNAVDILSIHNFLIRKYGDSESVGSFNKEYDEWKELYSHIHNGEGISTKVRADVEMKLNTIKQQISEEDNRFHFYLINVIPLLEKYKEEMRKKVKIDFMKSSGGEEKCNDSTFLKTINDYIEIVRMFFPDEMNKHEWDTFRNDTRVVKKKVFNQDVDFIITESIDKVNLHGLSFKKKNNCVYCKNESADFRLFDNHLVCETCGYIAEDAHHSISYKDIDRVNMSSKYSYDRRTHFRDSLNQFQGRQNVYVDKKIYDDLLEQLVLHRLIPENYETMSKDEAFSNITKEHIMLFLKETGHSKHYENAVFIYNELTGKTGPNISHLENALMHDFDQLADMYDKIYKNVDKRKNFINTQYVLYQLLKRHRFPCKKEDFNILKTIDRKYYHDEITKDLFERLGWNFSATF